MHPSLYVFSSYRYYQGFISSGVTESQVPLIKGLDWPNKNINVMFLNVASREEIIGNSVVNQRYEHFD